MIEKIRQESGDVILLDAGDVLWRGKDAPQLRAASLFEAMSRMGYDAVNLADGEMSLHKSVLVSLWERFAIPFVSANVRLNDSGGTIPRTFVIKKIQDLRVGITGITPGVFFSESRIKAGEFQVEAPVDRLKKAIEEMETAGVDLVILLSHMGGSGTDNLLRFNDLSRIDLAVVGHDLGLMNQPKTVRGTLVVQNSLKGEYLGQLDLGLEDDRRIGSHELKIIALTDEVPEDPDALRIMERFEKERARIEIQEREEKRKRTELETGAKQFLHLSPQEFLEKMKQRESEPGPLTNQPEQDDG